MICEGCNIRLQLLTMNMSEFVNLSTRLSAIASLVRDNVNFVDVGTDHGYLPIFLVKTNKLKNAVATDIACGPLSKAKSNIESAGLSENIEVRLSDGLTNVNLQKPCDIVIAGMGGELISEIISGKPELRDNDINLILQPMTKADCLREFLADNGFEIVSEELVCDGKIYQVILSYYSGKAYKLSNAEKLVGKKDARKQSDLFFEFVSQKIMSLRQISEGKKLANIDCSYEVELIEELLRLV